MSTIVYHHQQQQLLGFQQRHETHHHHQVVVEPSWSLSLKLNPPKHHQQHQIESTLKPPLVSSNSNNNYNTSSSSGGWTSIQSLTPSVNYSKDEVYVHPLTKISSSKLSDKSLEMCTENLGCETGTDIIHSSSSSSSSSNSSFLFSFTALSKPSNNQDSSSSSSIAAAAAVSSRQVMKRSHSAAKKTHSLPPPLTSMTGSSSLRVRPHRESGRLVMTAVSTSPRISNIQAERSNGRLTMCLVMDHSQESTVFPYNGTTTTTTGEPTDMINESDLVMTTHETDKCHVRCKQDEGEEEEEEDDDDKTIKQLEVIHNHNHIGISNSKEEGEEEEDDKSGVHVVETDKQEEASVDWRIVGVDQLHHQWPTRCNQNGGRGSNTTNCTTTLINWEPFWVAT